MRLEDYIVVICLKTPENYIRVANKYIQVVWMYNLWTEQWKKYSIPTREEPPTPQCCAVALASDIYIFGGGERSRRHGDKTTLWKLTDTELCTVKVQRGTKTPSPRVGHCGWEHGGKMWIFGGCGPSAVGNVFLNDYGDFVRLNPFGPAVGYNNQLFSYDQSMNIWKSVKPSGDIPPPRPFASTAIIRDTLWMFGGDHGIEYSHDGDEEYYYISSYDLHELNMNTFSWTQIQAPMPILKLIQHVSVTPIAPNQLVLHCTAQDWLGMNTTWILDVESHFWTEYPLSNARYEDGHSGTSGLHDVVILGGSGYVSQGKNTPVLSVYLGPKTLQQLAMKIIYENRTEMSWKSLPEQFARNIAAAGYEGNI